MSTYPGRIRVRFPEFGHAAQRLTAAQKDLLRARGILTDSVRGISWKVGADAAIRHSLNTISEDLDQSARLLSMMQVVLGEADAAYHALDKGQYTAYRRTNQHRWSEFPKQWSDLLKEHYGKDTESAEGSYSWLERLLLRETGEYSHKDSAGHRIMDWFKDIGNAVKNIGDSKIAGLFGSMFGYLDSMFNIFDEKTSILEREFKLTKSSASLYTGFFSFAKANGMIPDPVKKQWKGRMDVIGVVGNLFGVGEAVVKFGRTGTGADAAGIGNSGADLLNGIFKIGKDAERVKGLKGVFKSSDLWCVFGKTILSTGGQTYDSIKKYAADGRWDWNDTACTGIEGAVAGLDAMVSGLTFGVVSLDNFNSSPAQLSQAMENGTASYGKSISNYIMNHKDLLDDYNSSSSGLHQTRVVVYASIRQNGEKVVNRMHETGEAIGNWWSRTFKWW